MWPSVYVSPHLAYPSVCLSCLSIHHICLSVHCVCQSIYIVCPSAYPSIYLSICLSCLSVYRVCLSGSPLGSFPLESPKHYTTSAALGRGSLDGPVGFSTYSGTRKDGKTSGEGR